MLYGWETNRKAERWLVTIRSERFFEIIETPRLARGSLKLDEVASRVRLLNNATTHN